MARYESAQERVFQSIDAEYSDFYAGLSPENRRFVRDKISPFPREIQRILIYRYQSASSLFEANCGLREACKTIDGILPELLKQNFDLGEEGLRELANDFALRCRNISVRENSANARNRLASGATVNGGSESVNGQRRIDAQSISVNASLGNPPFFNCSQK